MGNDNLDQQEQPTSEAAAATALADLAAVDPVASTTSITNNGDGKAELESATKRALLYTRYAVDNEDQDHSNNTEKRARVYTRYALNDNEDQDKKKTSPTASQTPGVTWMENYDADQMAAMDAAAAADLASPTTPGAVSVRGGGGGGKGDSYRGYWMDNDSSGNQNSNPQDQEKKQAARHRASRYWMENDSSSNNDLNYNHDLNDPTDPTVDHQRREEDSQNDNSQGPPQVQRDPLLDQIMEGVAPLPLQRGPTHRDRRMDQSNPGAHRAGFNHRSDEFDSGDFNNSRNQMSIGDMAIANLVEDDLEQQDLPQAVPDSRGDEDIHHNSLAATRERERKRQLLCKGGICVTVLVAIVVIVLSVVLVPNAEQDDYDLYHLNQPTFQPSTSPTNAPTSFESHVLSLLPDYTIQAMDIDQDSPQARAFAWLMDDALYNPYMEDWRLLQRYSLATLYFATGGEKWIKSNHWIDHNVTECNWFSLIDSPLFRKPPTCNVNGTFEHLGLQKNNLVNSMPLELFLLTNLRTLNLGLNRMQGPFPTNIGQLTKLEGLWIFHLKNGGPMPSQLGQLTKLQTISLVNNHHTGRVPTQIGRLTNMMSLFLGGSPDVTGPLPNVTLMSNLWYFHVDRNSHTGTIPAEIFKHKDLSGIMFGGNNLHGTIPTQIGKLNYMAFLSTYGNQLTGTLPTELGLLTHTTLMTFNDNQLTGTIPSQLGELTGIWQKLAFNGNPELTGSLPTQLGRLTILEYLSVQGNNHTGPIPSQLGVLPMIGKLVLSNNSLTGTIPMDLEPLQDRLYYLDIQGNPMLSGTVPEALCNLDGQCIMYSWTFLEPCPKENYFAHDCTDMLCGCDCPCGGDDGDDASGNTTVATEVGDRGSSSTLLTILNEEP